MTERKVPRSFWIPDLEADLIDQIRPRRAIWDSKDSNYGHKRIKKHHLKEILEILHDHWPQYARQLTEDLVVKKFNIMKSYYTRELRKIEKAATRGQTYMSQWEHFGRLSYLGSNCEYKRNENEKKRIINDFKTSAPTIVSFIKNNGTGSMSSAESEDSYCDLKPGAYLALPEISTSDHSMGETPTSETMDDKFGHFIASVMQSIPESKEKDNMRMKIMQDIFDFKNS